MKQMLLMAVAGMLCVCSVAVLAGHPLTTDDPFPVGPGALSLDQSYDSRGSENAAVITFTSGLVSDLDIGFCVGQETGGKSIDPQISVKWLAFGEDEDAPAGAVTFGYVTKPHSDDKEAGNRPDFGINLVYQHPSRVGMLYANLGHTWAGDVGYANYINCSVALKHDFSSTFSLVGELVEVLGTRAVEGEPRTVREYLLGGVYTDQTGLTYSAGAAYSPDNTGSAWRITSGMAMEF